MKARKKLYPEKLRIKRLKKNFSAIFDKAEKGDVESMMRILMESDRGYEMSEDDLGEILRNRQEGCLFDPQSTLAKRQAKGAALTNEIALSTPQSASF